MNEGKIINISAIIIVYYTRAYVITASVVSWLEWINQIIVGYKAERWLVLFKCRGDSLYLNCNYVEWMNYMENLFIILINWNLQENYHYY